MMHNVTAEVTSMMTAGLTISQIDTELRTLTGAGTVWDGDDYFISTRSSLAAVEAMVSRVTASQRSASQATDKQVAFITRKLVDRIRTGDTSGYVSTAGLIDGYNVNAAAVRSLTKRQASQLIDSLLGTY